MLLPHVAKTWGLMGQTPVLNIRGRHREKISVIAALTLSTGRRRAGLYFNTRTNGSIDGRRVVAFLRDLLRHLRGPVVLVWDRLNTHRSRRTKAFLEKHRRLRTELLPPYAPDLNPVEWLWEDGKCHELANHGILDISELRRRVRRHARKTRRKTHKLRGFFRSAKLPMNIPAGKRRNTS